MAQSSIPLTSLTEAQRAQAVTRFTIIRPALEDGITQAQVARTHTIPAPTVRRWMKRYRDKGLAGLADAATRSDKGKSRRLPPDAIALIEGLALQKPQRSMAALHRQVVTIRATHSNAIWQADHTPLDILLLDEEGKPAKPWLTVIEDDYSRAIAGYRLSFQDATALTTALTLRTAIWRKEDPRWQVCGIPSVFYTDHGPDFTSKHMEQVAADLPMELIFSKVKVPRGRGKVERFFRTVNELLLQDLPGYAPEGATGVEAKLTLPAFEQRFRNWLLSDYHHRRHSEIKCTPASRWEKGGFVPRMPISLEQLDLLLLTVRKARRVQQDGIRFEGYRYIDPTLASYVREDVLIRYDPADLAEIRVYYQDTFLCRAICQELSGQTVSLKEIEKARNERRKQVRSGLSSRAAIVEQFIAVHHEEPSSSQVQEKQPEPVGRPKLKGYINE
jgi:putative transposase